MDFEQNFAREAGSGRDVAFEKNAVGILEIESSLDGELDGDRERERETVAEENRLLKDGTLTDQKKLRGKTLPNQLLQGTRN